MTISVADTKCLLEHLAVLCLGLKHPLLIYKVLFWQVLSSSFAVPLDKLLKECTLNLARNTCGAFMCEKVSLFVNKYVCSSFCFYSVNFLLKEKIIVQGQKFLLLLRLQLLSQNTFNLPSMLQSEEATLTKLLQPSKLAYYA